MTKENRLVKYLQDSKTEIKKISWPTKKSTTAYSIGVIIITLGTAVFLGGIDYLFAFLVSLVVTN